MSRSMTIGVGGRMFGILALNGLVAFTIGLTAYKAFDVLHTGITEVTSELFPAVVASAKLERQHQRIMRSIEGLALASNNLNREAIGQGLDDQIEGYDLLLNELKRTGGLAAQQLVDLRDQHSEIVRIRDLIDKLVASRIDAGKAMREADRDIRALSNSLANSPLRHDPHLSVRRWFETADRLLFLGISVQSIENSHALDKALDVARQKAAMETAQFQALPAPVMKSLRTDQRALEVAISGERSIFRNKRTQLEATTNIDGLLDRADQISLVNTGLNSGVFVEQTTLAERKRQQVLGLSGLYTKLFFASVGLVIIGVGLTLVYVQRRVVGRLWQVCQAIRDKSDGKSVEIPASGDDEIAELAHALRFFIRETESKNTELRKNESWLRAILDSAPLPLLIFGREDGKIRFVNRRAQAKFDVGDETKLIGTQAVRLWGQTAAYNDFVETLPANASGLGEVEAELVTMTGHPFWGVLSGTPFEYRGEDVLLVSLADITRRKEAEGMLMRAQERAERADAAKTEFLATMSHEMRTPLNGILGLGRLLLSGRLSREQRHYAESIQLCGTTLLDQVNDILDLRRIEEGKLDLLPAPCDLKNLFDNVIATVGSVASEHKTVLTVDIDPSTPKSIVVDAQRLRQILINLVGNAVKFTEEGSVEVSVMPQSMPAGDRLEVRVKDTGIGIPAERHKAIFEKLGQADPTIPRRFGGTGLGLAIVKRLLAEMGGDIGVESAVGVGSIFTFHIPLVRTEGDPQFSFSNEAVLPSVSPLSLLVVEDQEINQEVALGLLARMGHRATLAETGAKALELVAQDHFDAILLDIRLPDIDGVEVARQVRTMNDGEHATIPILALTANVFQSTHLHYLAAGIDAVVEKPLFPERLARALAEVLAKKRREGFETGVTRQTLVPVLDDQGLGQYAAQLGAPRFRKILGLLDETAASQLPKLTAAGLSDTELADAAHKLAGAASHFRLEAFVALVREIEGLLRAGRRQDALPLMANAALSFSEARRAMDAWLQRTGF
ncbi:ATP-binding protein [Telmatospirillum sp.]|uniref:ATP-binding protein n=1 Tax=Telmatospirillum sp. TaxID=2079197 RepID=UPI00284E7133|nr:ATP-binding protein [Telmatospirillum sp.]MDR3440085.1 ATP-binding protein [Telmatospirillum sp.]